MSVRFCLLFFFKAPSGGVKVAVCSTWFFRVGHDSNTKDKAKTKNCESDFQIVRGSKKNLKRGSCRSKYSVADDREEKLEISITSS